MGQRCISRLYNNQPQLGLWISSPARVDIDPRFSFLSIVDEMKYLSQNLPF
jgi:hypothetical protein